jgi:hydrogenase nickel incorporation protein HypB
MCTVCGCGERPAGGGRSATGHDHSHDHDHGRDLHFGTGPGGSHVPGMDQRRIVAVERDILSENDRFAAANRRRLGAAGVFAVNLVSGPGSGKTTLLARTIADCGERFPMAVIEGDQQTALDAERIRATGVAALQVNTGKGCHLDAHMVGHALDRLDLPEDGVLFVENVGNLVCPAAFDLGEASKAVVLSVTEGEDKPLKYPDMFAAAGLMVLNKVDLLPHLSFDVERCVDYARRINPTIVVLRLSAVTGEGLDAWYGWLAAGVAAARAGHAAAE